MNLKYILLISIFFGAKLCFGQDDLLSGLSQEGMVDPVVHSTFKSSRVINSQSVETLYRGNLDVRISHRFGKLNSGAYNFFGLDQSTIRLGLEYGLTDRITIGVGRSSFQKIYDSFAKVKLVQQRNSSGNQFPVSITWFSNATSNTLRHKEELYNMSVKYRYAFAHQIIVARKFSKALSIQVAPLLIHRNLKEFNENNDSYFLEGGAKVSISKRLSLNADYIYRLDNYQKVQGQPRYYNSLSLGVDIETGGHVFQLHVTNSQGMIEELFASRTNGTWGAGDIFYGFNISRQFNTRKGK